MWVILHTWEASWGGGFIPATAELERRSRYFNRVVPPSPLSLAVTLLAPPPRHSYFPSWECCRDASSACRRKGEGGRGAKWFTYVGQRVAFLSAQLIQIPGTEEAECDVWQAGGVGLICMSGLLLHLQIGIHRVRLSTPCLGSALEPLRASVGVQVWP